MASNSASEQAVDTRSPWRLAIWGISAVAALGLAIVVGSSALSARRSAKPAPVAQETMQKSAQAAQNAARSAEIEAETRRLAEIVRLLSSDRDRLATRIAVLERGLEDLTGSIRRQAVPPATPTTETAPAEKQSAVRPAPTAMPAPTLHATAAEPVAPAVNPAAPSTALTPPPRGSVATVPGAAEPRTAALQPAGDLALPVVARTDGEPPVNEFGIDIGGAGSFDGLRTLWVATKNQHVGLLDDFQPVVAVRENTRSKSPDLRLIVGPVENAEAAARICAKLTATKRHCQLVAFQGQRLARADAAPPPERKPAAPAPKQATPPPPPPAPPPASPSLPWPFR